MVATLSRTGTAVRRALCWGKGVFWASEPPPKVVPDVVIAHRTEAGDVHGEVWTLTTMLERMVSKSVGGDGLPVEVQNFRMVWADGDVRRIVVCGSCGMVATYACAEFLTHMPTECRRCGAGASPRHCLTGHGFGECPGCGPGTEGVP